MGLLPTVGPPSPVAVSVMVVLKRWPEATHCLPARGDIPAEPAVEIEHITRPSESVLLASAATVRCILGAYS
jgi:hypothetical protein